jgi:hypothetical protein
LITGHAMAEQDPGRQRQHLLDESRRRQAALAPAEPISVQPGVEASLGVAALISGQGAAGGAGAAAGAGDSDRAGFAVVRREGQGGTVGLGSSHRRGDARPALQPRRKARASHQRMAERSGAQRPARLASETLAKARSMEGPAAPTSQMPCPSFDGCEKMPKNSLERDTNTSHQGCCVITQRALPLWMPTVMFLQLEMYAYSRAGPR